MNSYQTIANGAYGDAYEIAECCEDPEHNGDTLAEYVARELSDGEECESIDEAIGRIGTAIDELEQVQMALIKGEGEGVA